MNKLYLLAALTLTLASCDTLTKSNLKGQYEYIGSDHRMRVLDKFELTPTKFIMPRSFIGEAAMDYKVEDGYVYAGPEGGQIRFRIIGDTLRNEGTAGMDGDYVRVRQ